MQLLLVSACLAIFCSALTSASDPHYVITIRAQLVQGSQQKACVTFLDLVEKVDFKLDLHKDEHTHIIAEGKIETPDYSECFTFNVPVVEEEFSVWSFHVLAHGEHINIDEKKLIAIIKGYDACFIQTDKATYKPGDTVKFRVMAVDMDFRAAQKKFPLLELKDPKNNRIGQWLNATVNHGIADFHFPLANELSLGTYKINASGACEQDFTVSEYVPKRFEFKLNVPPTVAVTDKSFHLEACGSYTYGKPVQGSIKVTVCPPFLPYSYDWHIGGRDESEKCILLEDVKTDSKGCLSKEIDITVFKLSKDHSKYIYISSSLTEEGTGHIEEASANIPLSKYKGITFVEIGKFYVKGVPFHIKVRVVDEKHQPMANQAVSIYLFNSLKIADLVTEKNGIGHCTLNTSTWDSYQHIIAKFSSDEVYDEESRYEHASEWISPFYSESKSLLNVRSTEEKITCDSDLPVTVEYNINKSGLDHKSDHLTFFYFLLSKGRINSYKEHKLDLKEHVNNPTILGTFPINVHVDRNLAPVFEFFIFAVLPKGETIASRAQYKVSDCSINNVQLSFSEGQVRPGEKVNLKVTAESGSWCSVRSVDKGFLLHAPHKETSFTHILSNGLAASLQDGIPDNVTSKCQGREIDDSRLDVSSLFESEHLKVITNTRIKKPVICEPPDWFAGRASLKPKKDKSPKEKDEELKRPHTRADFPDTWLFDIVSVGPEGHTELNLTTPDTITKWVTDAVCLGNSGVSEIRDVGLITFLPYFIDLIVPYSVVQGETFTIQALVFNYVKSCVLVVVSLSESEAFLTTQKKEQARCICEGQSTHFTWEATALHLETLKIHVSSGSLQLDGPCTEDQLSLGVDHKEDSIEKTVVVKPLGREMQKTETFLLYPADSSTAIQVSFHVPERLVPGSAHAHIIVMGHLMDNIVLHLDTIVNMAEGCAEQNIAKLSRYVYALEYLQSISELTPELKQKGVEAMIEGYQRQLTYKNENGSYGEFPTSKPNFWITALVVKAFSSAQDFIYIDQTNIQKAVTWLHNQQLPNGCFDVSDDYFNNDLEAENVVAGTAYVVIALLEHHVVYNRSIAENALTCLRKEAHSVTSPFTQALLAYAFTLSGDSELRQEALKRLDKTAIKKVFTSWQQMVLGLHYGKSKHWETYLYEEVNIETCGYVILALLSGKTTTQREIEESAEIVCWVMRHQYPWGGFRSSEDTTVAIQALAKYAKATHHKREDATVTVESKSGFHKEIHVDKDNNALLQRVDLTEFPGEYTVTATGKGIVYVQSHLYYNSFPDASHEHFAVNVSTEPSVCTHKGQRKFEVHVDVRYTGRRPQSNMAMAEVEILSGFVPDKKSIKKLEENPKVKKTELSKDHITIYLDKLTHKSEKFIFALKEETHVKNLHPANIFIFDYYQPNIRTLAEYTSPCNTMKGHCIVGVSERTDCGHPGITKEQCEDKGCCYDSSISHAKWCFFHGHEKEESH